MVNHFVFSVLVRNQPCHWIQQKRREICSKKPVQKNLRETCSKKPGKQDGAMSPETSDKNAKYKRKRLALGGRITEKKKKMVLFQKWCEASALWTNHFSCLAGSWKSRSEAYIYITGILPHKDHSWNVEWGNCSGLVYATPILTHILLLFLSCTSGILTKSFLGTRPAGAPCAARFPQVCVCFWCDSVQKAAASHRKKWFSDSQAWWQRSLGLLGQLRLSCLAPFLQHPGVWAVVTLVSTGLFCWLLCCWFHISA